MTEPDFKTTYRALIEAEDSAELEAFARAAREEPEPADFETVASWRALRRRLAPRRRWQVPVALAASFLLAAVGVTSWMATQEQTPTLPRAALANTAIVDLVDAASRRTGDGPPQEIAATGAGAVLVLTPDDVPVSPSYEVRIFDAAGTPVRTVTGLERHRESDTFTLFLPPGALADGEYRFELHGASGEPIARYRVRWTGAAASPSPE